MAKKKLPERKPKPKRLISEAEERKQKLREANERIKREVEEEMLAEEQAKKHVLGRAREVYPWHKEVEDAYSEPEPTFQEIQETLKSTNNDLKRLEKRINEFQYEFYHETFQAINHDLKAYNKLHAEISEEVQKLQNHLNDMQSTLKLITAEFNLISESQTKLLVALAKAKGLTKEQLMKILDIPEEELERLAKKEAKKHNLDF